MTQKGRIKSLLNEARWNYYARLGVESGEIVSDELIDEMTDQLMGGGMTVELSAKWLRDEEHSTKYKSRYVCSNCLHYQTQNEHESSGDEIMYMIYCPFCGAKMEAEEAIANAKEPAKRGHWIYWGGWCGNHDMRIEDAVCSECGYKHPTVRLEPGAPRGEAAFEAVLDKLT